MKRYIYIIFSLFLIYIVFTSCSDDYLNHSMVNDKIYLNSPGFNETNVFNWGTFTYDLVVVKGGKGMQNAQLKLAVEDSILTNYNEKNNKNYKLLPDNCYLLKTSELSIGKEEYQKSFQIEFNTEALTELQKNTDDIYVLPCQMLILNNSIEIADKNKMTTIIAPIVKQPYLELANPGLYLPGLSMSAKDDDILMVHSMVKTNYYNEWDLTYTLEIDPTALVKYNEENGTSYKLLPEAAYEINSSNWKLRPKEVEQYFEIKIKKTGLVSEDGKNMYGEYVIPVRLSSVSIHGINPDANVMLYPILFQVEETDK